MVGMCERKGETREMVVETKQQKCEWVQKLMPSRRASGILVQGWPADLPGCFGAPLLEIESALLQNGAFDDSGGLPELGGDDFSRRRRIGRSALLQPDRGNAFAPGLPDLS